MPWPQRDRASSLAERAARGDRVAFRELYRDLHPVVSRFVRRRVSSAADAEDLVSKVFHKLVEHVGRFDRRKAGAKTWVLTMARNAVIDHYRTRKLAVSVDELADGLGDGEGGPLQVLIDDEEVRAVSELMEVYPPQVRTMLSLRYGDGLKHREIAQLLNMSEAAVKQRLSRTLRDMRERSEVFSRRGVVDFAV
jgi:RNA polymerase sigma-70 factor (ECF subfamily)